MEKCNILKNSGSIRYVGKGTNGEEQILPTHFRDEEEQEQLLFEEALICEDQQLAVHMECETADLGLEQQNSVNAASISKALPKVLRSSYKKQLSSGRVNSKLELEVEQIELILAIYKKYPTLWNAAHVDYRFRVKQSEAWELCLLDVNTKLKTKWSLQILRQKLHVILEHYKTAKMAKLKAVENYMEFCAFYNTASYLESYVAPFQCEVCLSFQNSYDGFLIHKAKHEGTSPFQCSLCEMGFNNASNLRTHLRRHTRNFAFECKMCGEGFATSTDYKAHLRKHTGEKPYCCEKCGKSFRTWSLLNCHKRRHDKQKNYECLHCNRSFYDNESLLRHTKGQHLQIKDIKCNICDKAFAAKRYLRAHMFIHEPIKRYECKICSKRFAQGACLNAHLKTHRNI